MQYWAKNPEKKILNPTKGKRMETMGRFWVDDRAEQRADTLEGANVIESTDVHKHMGCTLSWRKAAQVPKSMEGIQQDTQEQLERYKAVAAAAAVKMVIESKMATIDKWYAVYNTYRPTGEHHKVKDALLRRCYKAIRGISRRALRRSAGCFCRWCSVSLGGLVHEHPTSCLTFRSLNQRQPGQRTSSKTKTEARRSGVKAHIPMSGSRWEQPRPVGCGLGRGVGFSED